MKEKLKKYEKIQQEIIQKYRIDICDGTKCRNDWRRTHAHTKIRRVCKWKQSNSIASTFILLHEVGHIVNNKGKLRRCEEEYYATIWAIEEARKYNLEIPIKTIEEYQRYIYMELERGLRRSGSNYPSREELKLIKENI